MANKKPGRPKKKKSDRLTTIGACLLPGEIAWLKDYAKRKDLTPASALREILKQKKSKSKFK